MIRGRVVTPEVAREGKDVVAASELRSADIRTKNVEKVPKEIIPTGGNGSIQSRFRLLLVGEVNMTLTGKNLNLGNGCTGMNYRGS